MEKITKIEFNSDGICIIKKGRKHFAKVVDKTKLFEKNISCFKFDLKVGIGYLYSFNTIQECIEKINYHIENNSYC